MRSGRLTYQEREAILREIGKEGQRRYKEQLKQNKKSYNLRFLNKAFQFETDVYNFRNYYFVDTGDEEGNKLAMYFEYGTGLYNRSNRHWITPKPPKTIMKWRDKNTGEQVFAKKTQGVRATYMFLRTVKSLEFDFLYLMRKYRMILGI